MFGCCVGTNDKKLLIIRLSVSCVHMKMKKIDCLDWLTEERCADIVKQLCTLAWPHVQMEREISGGNSLVPGLELRFMARKGTYML